ncbi:MAG: EAL domain-containing protein [Pseudolabrys sp.]
MPARNPTNTVQHRNIAAAGTRAGQSRRPAMAEAIRQHRDRSRAVVSANRRYPLRAVARGRGAGAVAKAGRHAGAAMCFYTAGGIERHDFGADDDLMKRVCVEAGAAIGRRPGLKISFNFAAQLFRDESIIKEVRKIFSGTPIELAQVVLELTERDPIESLTENPPRHCSLQGLGVRIAIDDVGTGHSGLSYMLKLGVDIIKIDKMFIDAIGTDRNSITIVETLVDLAHNMRMDVVAEGVENFEQVVHLRELGIRSAQGYVFAPPLPGSAFPAVDGSDRSVAGRCCRAQSGGRRTALHVGAHSVRRRLAEPAPDVWLNQSVPAALKFRPWNDGEGLTMAKRNMIGRALRNTRNLLTDYIKPGAQIAEHRIDDLLKALGDARRELTRQRKRFGLRQKKAGKRRPPAEARKTRRKTAARRTETATGRKKRS